MLPLFPLQGDRWRVFAVALLVAGVWLALASQILIHTSLNADEGFYLAVSHALRDGLLPYRDYLYTQMPLLPILQAPPSALLPTSLFGIRLLALIWTTFALGLILVVALRFTGLARTLGIFLLVFLCLDPLGYLSIGKTYPLAHLLFLLTALPLFLSGNWHWRYVLLCIMGVLCGGVRLTMIPAVIVLWTGFCVPRRREMGWVLMLGLPLLLAMLLVGSWGAVEPVGFYYGIWQYHREALLPRHPPGFWRSALTYLPGVWLFLAAAFSIGWRRWDRPGMLLLLAAIAGSIANLGLAGIYLEYVVPFVIPGVLGAAVVLWEAKRPKIELAVYLMAASLLLWRIEMPRRSSCVEDATAAAEFLRDHTPENTTVLASMPEIPIEAGRPLLAGLLMGKFAVTAEYTPEKAAALHYMHYGTLLQLIGQRKPAAIVFSTGRNANFNYSVPSLRVYRPDMHRLLLQEALSCYSISYYNATYVVLLRRDVKLSVPPSEIPAL
jgi:hypothetical protein